jgi:hypothetical protein
MIRAVPIGFKERLADPFDLSQRLGARLIELGRVLINAGIGRMSALGANRTRWDGGNVVNDPELT